MHGSKSTGLNINHFNRPQGQTAEANANQASQTTELKHVNDMRHTQNTCARRDTCEFVARDVFA
eukprot:60027-Alexandrium_andersonii.AAC.1